MAEKKAGAKKASSAKKAASAKKATGAAKKTPAKKKATSSKGPAAKRPAPTHAEIAKRAYEIHEREGGSHEDNWLRAERELKSSQ